jgi:hypothetical protein
MLLRWKFLCIRNVWPKVKDIEVCRAYGTHGRGEKSEQGFGEKARRKENSRKTDAWMGSEKILGRLPGGGGGCGVDVGGSGLGPGAGAGVRSVGSSASGPTELVVIIPFSLWSPKWPITLKSSFK